MGTAHVPADLTGPASVMTHGFGTLELGGFTTAAHGHAAAVAELLRSAAFDVRVASDINVSIWEKLAFNAALNAIAMICQVTNAGIDNDPGRRLAIKVVEETVNVAASSAIRLDQPRIVDTLDAALREHAFHKASMLQDRERRRPTEIETINGAIARQGARMGVPTPVCDTLVDLVRIIELASNAMTAKNGGVPNGS
jgi:2-dehydropantoate 2-reductase